MNELIKQFVIQAGFSETYGLKEKERLNKFAELIVLECIKVMVKNDYHGEWLGEKIKDHFGVE
jgi:hypothetical protein